MAVTVRLGAATERALQSIARQRKMSRSDVVREAIAHYGAAQLTDAPDSPAAAWADVIGVVNLGVRNPEVTTGEQFAAALRRNRRARHAR